MNSPACGSSSLLHELMQTPHLDLVLIKKILYASPSHVVHWRDHNGRTPLHLLARVRKTDASEVPQVRNLLKLLLDLGASPLAVDEAQEMAIEFKPNPSSEIQLLLRAHLERKVHWEQNSSGNYDWIAKYESEGVTFRNGKKL